MSKRIKYTDAVPNSIVTRYKEDNTQYLLDQVSRLTAENAMLKEKWLSQPEHIEQQAEAWIIVNKETGYRTQVSDLTPFLYHREIFEVIPLYTAPPKREPLGEEESYHEAKRLYEAEDGLWYEDGFVDGLKFAEKMHGIGGEE